MAPAPPLSIPSGTALSVKIIDTTSSIGALPIRYLMGPPMRNFETCPTMPSFSFLIEHPSGRKLLFDLGIRKDWHNHAPIIAKRILNNGWDIRVQKSVSEILEENGVDLKGIEGMVWSHWHWDHLGDPSLFPSNTALVVGPGVKKNYVPGAPANPESPILESDYKGRELVEIDFDGPNVINVGKMKAYDWFKDGSFYLLDTPGHAIGHLCGLARTTSNPDTFIFMGGDACHHGGEFRPSEYLPLPSEIDPHPLKGFSGPFCPGADFEAVQKERGMDTTGAFFVPMMGHDIPEAIRTIGKVQEADADENVFVVMAHDDTVAPTVDLFPKAANDWKARGWANHVKWAFLKDLMPTLKK